MKLLLAFIFFIFLNILEAKYTSLDDALKNGVSRGDGTLYFNYSGTNNGRGYSVHNSVLTNSSLYVLGSTGLGYTSGFYYNIRGTISFRAISKIYDIKSGFIKDPQVQSVIGLGASFFEYYDGDTAIKIGRIMPHNEYINHLVDGVWVRNGSLQNIILESIWVYRHGIVNYRDIINFRNINRNSSGYFSVGGKYYFSDIRSDYKNSTYSNVFINFIPDIFFAIGTRTHLSHIFNNSSFWIGTDFGFVYGSYDKKNNKSKLNTYIFDAKAIVSFIGLDFIVGYVKTGRLGFGYFNTLGVGNGPNYGAELSYRNIHPFFTWGGRAIKNIPNSNLLYGVIQSSFFNDTFKLYVAYGTTFFNEDIKLKAQNELNVMTDFFITNNVSAILFFTDTHFGKKINNYTEIGVGIRLNF